MDDLIRHGLTPVLIRKQKGYFYLSIASKDQEHKNKIAGEPNVVNRFKTFLLSDNPGTTPCEIGV